THTSATLPRPVLEMILTRFVAAVLVAFATAVSLPLHAQPASQPYPSRPIQLVVPFAVASGIDQLGREYAELLRVQMNTPFVVDNREGAGGLIGGTFVARAQP